MNWLILAVISRLMVAEPSLAIEPPENVVLDETPAASMKDLSGASG